MWLSSFLPILTSVKTAKFAAQLRTQKDYAHLREKAASEKPSDLFKVSLTSVEDNTVCSSGCLVLFSDYTASWNDPGCLASGKMTSA